MDQLVTIASRPLLSLAALLVAAVAVSAAPTEFVVSLTGNDQDPGTAAKPFATIGRAMKAVRELKLAQTNPGPVTVTLHGGLYQLTAPVVFTPADSGTETSPVTWTSAPGEQAVISGGRLLTGTWQQVAGKPYWQTTVPQLNGQPWIFNTITINGQSRDRARTPNYGEKVYRAAGRAPGEDPRQSFRYLPGDLDPSWSNLTDVDLVLLCSWTPTIHRIQEVDGQRRIVKFHSSHTRTVDAWEKNFRYYAANVFEALDSPGEWYLNRHTATLYYYPKPGEDMTRLEVVAPVLKSRLVTFQGDVEGGRFIEHLRFQDLGFKHVDGDLDRYNGVYRQGHMFLDAGVYAEGLRHSSFTGCEFAQLGEYGIELNFGCQDNRIEHCHIHDLGAGAMELGLSTLNDLLTARMTQQPGDLVAEAEAGELTAPMATGEDANAAGGRYAVLPEDHDSGACKLTVNVPQGGRYRLLLRSIAPDGQSDSIFAQLDDGPRYTCDLPNSRSWIIAPLAARELQGKAIIADLGAGAHTVILGGREAGAKLDQLLLRPVTGAADAEDPAPREVLRTVVDNNIIHRLGTLWHGCYGIVNRFASFSKITHNDIFDCHWDAIGLDARWNYQGETYSHGNEIAYNHLHHLGLRYHTDAGGVYQFGPLDTHIHHNLVHDNVSYPYICGYGGIYLDEQSHGALVENNLVYNVEWMAYFQHWGSDNVFRNNIGAFARNGFFLRGGVKQDRPSNYCEVYRNIYLTDDDQPIKGSWVPGEKPTIFRDNLFWSTKTGDQVNFGGLPLDEWAQKEGATGLVVMDPGFKDPLHGDFTLPADSPALKAIGFVPFSEELKQAGLYGDEAWTSLPDRCERRQPSQVWTAEDFLKLISFDLDFEDMPDGYEPDVFRLTKDGEATFTVTSEAACTGTKSLKCIDRKALKKAFYPYLMLSPKGLNSGRISYGFDFLINVDQPAPFYTEFRGKGFTSDVGPSLRFNVDGTVLANGKPVMKVKPGTWTRVDVSFELGEGAPKEYTLTLKSGAQEQTLTVPFSHQTFSEIDWLGICADGDVDGVFYLDNMVFRVE